MSLTVSKNLFIPPSSTHDVPWSIIPTKNLDIPAILSPMVALISLAPPITLSTIVEKSLPTAFTTGTSLPTLSSSNLDHFSAISLNILTRGRMLFANLAASACLRLSCCSNR